MEKLKTGLVQMSCAASVHENVEKAKTKVRELFARGARLVVLPELFSSQYFCQSENHAYFELAECKEAVLSLFEEFRKSGQVLVIPFFEKRAPGLYHNSVVILGDKGEAGFYRKNHIPDDPLYLEKFYFTPGDTGYPAFETQAGKIGVGICWDQWFPETARLLTLSGAQVLIFPTAIGWHPSEKQEFGKKQLESWKLIQRSHAIANGTYVLVANRVGHEKLVGDGIEFWGHSFIADPQGEILVEGGENEETVLFEIDLKKVEEQRTHWPFIRDRRIDSYPNLLKRWAQS